VTDETPVEESPAEDTPADELPAEESAAAEAGEEASEPLPPPPPVGGEVPPPPPADAPVAAAPAARAKVAWPTRTKAVVLGGAALVLIGSFLPWAKAEATILGQTLSNTANGMDGDGKITLVLALVAAGVFFFVPKAKAVGGLVLAAGLLAGMVAIIDIVDVSNKADDINQQIARIGAKGAHADATVSFGLWIVAIGAIVLIVGGILCLLQKDEVVGGDEVAAE
jgi:hypothetical protein